jgi:type I restriction enzyme R subunit
MLAVVEAKSVYKLPGDGLQQAKDYAELLGLKFAYSTNGHGIVEFDYASGKERQLESFPTPDELWERLRSAEKITSDETAIIANSLLPPMPLSAKASVTIRKLPSTAPCRRS